MRIYDLMENIKVDKKPYFTMITANYQPNIKHMPNAFLFPNIIMNTPFGKFLVRGLQTPITTQKESLRGAGYKVLKKYGVPDKKAVDRPKQHAYPEWGWDGTHLYTDSLDGEQLFHEISHWVVTTTEHRNKPDFDMGAGFNSAATVSSIRSPLSNQHEEYEAVALDMCLMRAVRGNVLEPLYAGDYTDNIPPNAQEEFGIQEGDVIYFQNRPLASLSVAFDRLVSRGIITANGDPTWAVGVTK